MDSAQMMDSDTPITHSLGRSATVLTERRSAPLPAGAHISLTSLDIRALCVALPPGALLHG